MIRIAGGLMPVVVLAACGGSPPVATVQPVIGFSYVAMSVNCACPVEPPE